MYFVCEFGYLLVELEKWPLWNEVTLELDYWWISWPTTAYFGICHHWELQQPRDFHGRSEWLWTWYQIRKKCGKEWMPSKILVISRHANAVVMLKIEARPGYTRTEGCSLAQEMNNNKDWILLRMLTFGFAIYNDFCKKPEGKKHDFCHFSMTLKTVIFVLVQIQKVICCKKRWLFYIYWISQFELNADSWQGHIGWRQKISPLHQCLLPIINKNSYLSWFLMLYFKILCHKCQKLPRQ